MNFISNLPSFHAFKMSCVNGCGRNTDDSSITCCNLCCDDIHTAECSNRHGINIHAFIRRTPIVSFATPAPSATPAPFAPSAPFVPYEHNFPLDSCVPAHDEIDMFSCPAPSVGYYPSEKSKLCEIDVELTKDYHQDESKKGVIFNNRLFE